MDKHFQQKVRSQVPRHEKDISFLWPSHILCFPDCTATFPSLYLLFHSFTTAVVMFIFITATFTVWQINKPNTTSVLFIYWQSVAIKRLSVSAHFLGHHQVVSTFHSNTRIAYPTNNTPKNHLTQNTQGLDKLSLSGAYKLTCPDCKKVHIGQRWRNFITRYNEHKCSFRNNSHNSKFAQHLVENMHSFGNIHDIVQILHFQKKGHNSNAIERFHIHIQPASKNHLNDDHTISPNRIFDTILNKFS
jgi:hypothetical protein